ncbi:Ankyrin Repeat Protein [Seminavis robusta]|uniref:Ankyrin Repeat Protein n=1 Tax=Seminavis robusta TaxID=568900 RepID=A0A9N8DKB0_9STRA|nr:Ankyrin Repeat Protein [Seminavis robusta]|eukprot:Sro205_g086260.1 Ankyrin Repeat Protein (412) ;mRNA; f:47696-48931
MNSTPELPQDAWKCHPHLGELPGLEAKRGSTTAEELQETARTWRRASISTAGAEATEGEGIFVFAFAAVVQSRQYELVRVYLDNGADPNSVLWSMLLATNSRSRWANTQAQELVRELLERGANPNRPAPLHSSHNSPLSFAMARNNAELVRMLLDHGADVTAATIEQELGRTGPEILSLLLQNGAKSLVNEQFGKQQETALHRAAALFRHEAVGILLAHGANPNLRNSNGDTPLHLVSNAEAARLLLDAGTNVKAVNNLGETALHSQMATDGYANKDVVALLLGGGIPVNYLNQSGVPALDYAAKYRDSLDDATELVPLLLRHGADPNVGNCNALHHTAKHQSDFPALRALLRHGASTATSKRDSNLGVLPLDCACEAGNLDAVFEITMAMVGEGNMFSRMAVQPAVGGKV